jgi:3-oxoacyl-[acyl-carrier protein] reductase
MDGNEARTIIVTGGGTGMGRAITAAFARRGEQVVILGRREDVLRETAEALGPSVSWHRADVSQREDVEEAVGAVVARHDRVHVLVNAAGFANGVSADTPLAEAERRWDDTVGTNLKGAFLMSIAVAPHLARPGGRIVNISSIAAYTGGSRGGSIEYAAAKAGIHGLTMGLARDLSGQGITVNAIVPGFIAETEFTGGWSEERVRQIVTQTPAGRPGKPDDIASAVLFLASPEAAFITGEALNVNGGWLFGR